MHYDKLKDNNINTHTAFWIGDPCYVVPDQYWGPLCDNWQAFESREENQDLPRSYVAEVSDEEAGLYFYVWNTAYGDGSYPLFVNNNEVASLAVDAGCLSAIPVSLINHWKREGIIGDYHGMGHVVNAEHLRGELVSEGGDMFWGDVRLPTGMMEDDEEEDPWAECEEEGFFL